MFWVTFLILLYKKFLVAFYIQYSSFLFAVWHGLHKSLGIAENKLWGKFIPSQFQLKIWWLTLCTYVWFPVKVQPLLNAVSGWTAKYHYLLANRAMALMRPRISTNSGTGRRPMASPGSSLEGPPAVNLQHSQVKTKSAQRAKQKRSAWLLGS